MPNFCSSIYATKKLGPHTHFLTRSIGGLTGSMDMQDCQEHGHAPAPGHESQTIKLSVQGHQPPRGHPQVYPRKRREIIISITQAQQMTC